MRNLLNSWCSLLLLLLMGSSSLGVNAQNTKTYERDWRTDRVKVKIISYNIMEGFGRGEDKDRMARFTAWVKEQSPDVLALNELCGFTEAKLKALAASYGHPYVAIVKEKGYPVGLTSKTPLKVIDRNWKATVTGYYIVKC